MAIGVPISINDVTLKYTFGHFARLLIVINLSKNLHQQILVQREGYAFSIKVEYEKRPFFVPLVKLLVT